MTAAPKSKKAKANPWPLAALFILIAGAVVVAAVFLGSSTPKKKATDAQQTLQQRHVVGTMFLRQHKEINALVLAYKHCASVTCLDAKIHSVDALLAADATTISTLNIPVRAQKAGGDYVHVMGAIRIDFTTVLAERTLSAQKLKFNKLIIDGPQPLALVALFNKALALNEAMIA